MKRFNKLSLRFHLAPYILKSVKFPKSVNSKEYKF